MTNPYGGDSLPPRPNAYTGALGHPCPACGAIAGERCVIYVERLGCYMPRKMPCIKRIQLIGREPQQL